MPRTELTPEEKQIVENYHKAWLSYCKHMGQDQLVDAIHEVFQFNGGERDGSFGNFEQLVETYWDSLKVEL